jgi:hypothetical protein
LIFLTYFQRQIVTGKYEANVVLNVDETKIDFNKTSGMILAKIGTRLVSGKINGHSGRATVVLCVTMSGEKLPAFVIWKGVPNGWIKRECQGPQYPHNNMKYAMQPKGWLDSDTYQKWVMEVVLPYLNKREGYLLQDAFSQGGEHCCTTMHWSRGGIHPSRIHSSATSIGQRSTQDLQALLP